MSETPKIQSFAFGKTIDSISTGQLLSEQLTEELSSIIKKISYDGELVIILHDFEPPLNHTCIKIENCHRPLTQKDRQNGGKNSEARVFNNCYDILILPQDIELSMEEAADIVNTTPALLQLMLESHEIIRPNKTVPIKDILNLKQRRDELKRKTFD